ncbi:MAG: hypothetical protein ACI9Y7_000906 [Dokdonia sp.]|jgi:hypothetical protein
MKTILKTLFVIILSMLSFSFTTNNEKEETFKPIQELSSDARFISLLEEQSQVISKVKDLKTLGNYRNKESLSNTDINKVSSLLEYRSRAEFERSISRKNAIIKALDKDYNLGKYSEGQLTQLGLKAINNPNFKMALPLVIDVEPGGETNECEDLCEASRRSCLATALAAAIAAHIGCAALDAIGIGVACHIAVIAAQATASHQCNTTYDQCIYACRH